MSKLFAQRPLQQRRTLVLYLGTVVVAVAATIAMCFVAAAALSARRDATILVDLLREQQALAQRINYLFARAAEGDRASEFRRGQVTNRFARTHEQLRLAEEGLGVSTGSARAFQAVYAGGDRSLAADVQAFLNRIRLEEDDGRPKVQGADGSRAIAQFAGETFPNGLDPIVKAYLRTNGAKVDVLRWSGLALGALVLLALLTQGFVIAWPMWRRLGIHDEEAAAIDVTDPLTGALTAQSFAKRAVAEIRRARRYRRPVSVMTVATELPSGTDASMALRDVYAELSETLRPSDFVGVGEGGVFSVVLPETDLYAAELAGYRILRELDRRQITLNGHAITVGVGVAQIRADEALPDDPLARAIASMRQARAKGGDRVGVSPMREAPPAAM
ncbi:MAG: diguanylate cyclase [Methylobacterium sp.]|uniref:GGDEF domain-containing protein n=1 Tax=Methylobacterium sp. TaxID=409 RepID=UPI0025EC7100|nr:diguanylate cyclase [Methylobacterium sp.]MBX9932559.1 diguanylate cyclase [Methylobacterium sp.]